MRVLKNNFTSAVLMFTTATAAFAPLSGCDGLGGSPIILPLGKVTSVQLFEQPNYTVALSVENAVLNPDAVARVNWVFGDGTGFVEGPNDRATMTHRYTAPGTYPVTAYIFGASGFVDQIESEIVVVENDNGNGPGPNPTPEDLPGNITAPVPADNADGVALDVELRWKSGILTDSHDVYFGTDKAAVGAANKSAPEFQGNQLASKFQPPAKLDPDMSYFWRIDGVNELGTTKGNVLTFKTARAPQKARNPSPSTGSNSARVNGSLKWTAGNRATSHDVFFGADQAAVAAATIDDDEFQGNQTETTFDPEDESADVAGELLPDTEYFWRIDEVGPGGTMKGDLWSFRTAAMPSKVTMPAPADGETGVDIQQVLTWEATTDIEEFEVYLGVDAVDVAEADRTSPLFRTKTGITTYDPDSLLGSMTYFWRVDSLGKGGLTKGDVFSFTTADPPGSVVGAFAPSNGATNQDINPTLSWNVGGGGPTTLFSIYLSTTESAVVNRNAGALRSTQDVGFTTFGVEESSSLSPNTLYFWRVVAIGPGGRNDGPVLSFTTGTKPEIASGPNPANNANGVALDKMLSWSAATGANRYEVYFGTDQSAVSSANTDDAAFQSQVNTTDFDPGPLLGNTQYFWRVDARGPGGTTKGVVWRFKTAPEKAMLPAPFDGAEQIATDVSLSWTAGDGATSHDVYLGTDSALVAAATTASAGIFRVNQAGTTFTPNVELTGATTYFWRIDEVNANGRTKGDVWSFSTIAGQATDPSPANGASGVALTPTLSWTADAAAESHDVYFGESFASVNDATTSSTEYQGNFALGAAPPFQPPILLKGLTFYFWRVDTVTSQGVRKGVIWQFRTGPGRATSPTPANFATGVSVDTTISWTAGIGAVSHDVYFGTSMSDVTDSEVGALLGATTLVNVAVTEIDPGALSANTVYYWRVDSVASNGTTRTKGNIWRFTTIDIPAQAGPPTPFSGATNVALTVSLNWGEAARAESYDVYFGADLTAVMNATTASAEYQGNRTDRSYQPAGLANNTIYFWRIDAINSAGVRTGSVWSFTTVP